MASRPGNGGKRGLLVGGHAAWCSVSLVGDSAGGGEPSRRARSRASPVNIANVNWRSSRPCATGGLTTTSGIAHQTDTAPRRVAAHQQATLAAVARARSHRTARLRDEKVVAKPGASRKETYTGYAKQHSFCWWSPGG